MTAAIIYCSVIILKHMNGKISI